MAEKVFKRSLEEEIKRYLGRKEIIGVRGARQTGKTTLLKMIEEEIPGDRRFINLDLIENRRALDENPLDLVKRYKNPGKKLTLFLDEIQRVIEAGEKLKIIYDELSDLKILISGSSSLELKTHVLPPLVGRLFLFELYTFSFQEFLLTRDKGLARLHLEKQKSLKSYLAGEGMVEPPSFQEEFLKHWKEYVIYGGYPEVVKGRDPEEKTLILRNIFNLYLEKDISSYYKIEDAARFQDLLKILSFNIGQLLTISSTASDLKTVHRQVESYLSILEHTYIIRLLKPYHQNLRTELRKSPKPYFLDLGLRNSAIDNFSSFDSRSDAGALAENFVFRELTTDFRDWKLNYWRTAGKAEVDFLLKKAGEIVPVEVKLGRGKLGKSFHSFLNAYTPQKAVIASLHEFRKETIRDTTVHWVPLYYF